MMKYIRNMYEQFCFSQNKYNNLATMEKLLLENYKYFFPKNHTNLQGSAQSSISVIYSSRRKGMFFLQSLKLIIMGILKLMDFIRAKFPQAILHTKINTYQNRILAIDASNWIYQFLIKTQSIRDKSVYSPTDWMGNKTGHLIGIMSRVLACCQNNITPVWVFDGKPPQEKYDELKRRKQRKSFAQEKSQEAKEQGNMFDLLKMTQRTLKITDAQKQDAMKLVKLIGFPVIQAPSEAQPQCAWLVKNNLAYGTVSQDLDTLTFGCERLIRSFNKKDECVEVNLSTILKQSSLTYEQFIDLCILCGCDYSSKISKIGPVSAYNLLKKHHNIDKIIEHIMNDEKLRDKHPISDTFNHLRARKLFMEPQVDKIYPERLKVYDMYEGELVQFLKEKQFSQQRIQKWIDRIKKTRHP